MEQNRTHPMILTAAAAVIVTCGLAAASMTGLLPSSQAKEGQNTEQSKTELIEKATASSNKQFTEAPALAAAPSNSSYPPPQYQPVNAAPYEQPSSRYAAPREPEHAICRSCGKVIAVNPIKIQGEGTGVGAVAGGLAGALLGKQLGNGNGQKAFTVAGAVGGAYLGNNIEKERRSHTVYDVRVRFEDGRTHKYRESRAAWQVGDRVRVENGRLTSNY